jgi:hypothetical protein
LTYSRQAQKRPLGTWNRELREARRRFCQDGRGSHMEGFSMIGSERFTTLSEQIGFRKSKSQHERAERRRFHGWTSFGTVETSIEGNHGASGVRAMCPRLGQNQTQPALDSQVSDKILHLA